MRGIRLAESGTDRIWDHHTGSESCAALSNHGQVRQRCIGNEYMVVDNVAFVSQSLRRLITAQCDWILPVRTLTSREGVRLNSISMNKEYRVTGVGSSDDYTKFPNFRLFRIKPMPSSNVII